MKAFAGLVAYLAALTILLGGAAIGIVAFLSSPGDADPNAAAKRPPQQFVRAADRKKPAQGDDKAKAATAPAVPQAAPAAIPPHASAAELAKKQARLVKPKKAKPKPRPTPEIDDTAALGFAAPPRPFNSPFFR